ncbi:MAG: anthranilate phosphoribosyltransferase [Armatimonadota bacterium]|nr:anthranilate phosphoribosyltransferase [bacterium]MCS7308659.1 anthranilate phosphoribosyltransferase [Armatimonadota bacterium]MDW8103897.1 anthranilate phosphoribosyltransferase [Armatimonadota bacterium]MDW8289447.1 anthranilate phosphoribosyltransferase [Armatimonadota bacterium]
MTVQQAIAKLVEGQNLTRAEAASLMEATMSGQATPAQTAAWLVALRMKGETAEEIAGCAETMRRHAVAVRPQRQAELIDTCGTGADKIKTFNISTAVAFVVAAAGVPVAKHGNRAVTSKCGSADVLEALGCRLELSPERIAQAIDEIGIGFLFARAHHPAMKYAAPVRQELGIRTVFNVLGPLTNPAGTRRQLLGVFAPQLTRLLAEVLREMGAERAMVVYGEPGLDELSTLGETLIVHLQDGHLREERVTPEQFGLRRASSEEIIAPHSAQDCAQKLYSLLAGEQGAARDLLLLNAGAALVVGGKAQQIAEGIEVARETIDSGRALHTLQRYIQFTQEAEA